MIDSAEQLVVTQSGVPIRRGWWWVEVVEQSVKHKRLVIRCVDCKLVMFNRAICPRCGASEATPAVEPLSERDRRLLTLAIASNTHPVVKSERQHFSSENFIKCAADVLRVLRLAHGWSQNDIARLMSKPRTYFSKIERGGALPAIPSLVQFSVVFEIPVWVIAELIEAISRNPNAMQIEGERQ